MPKYFEHAGALLTADGTGDELIKLEGVPKGEKFTWVDDELEETVVEGDDEREPEPEDRAPAREHDLREREVGDDEELDEALVDDDDDSDEDDAPPAPKLAPAGFRIANTAPTEEQLAFSKEASPADGRACGPFCAVLLARCGLVG